MKFTDKWIWKLYFLIILTVYVGNVTSILNPQLEAYRYYHILIAFHKEYRLVFGLNVACAITNLTSLIPLFLYIFEIRWLPLRFWQWMMVCRVIFDLTGHAYEFNFLKSLFYVSLSYGLSAALFFVVFFIPSYIACFRYAFIKKKFMD